MKSTWSTNLCWPWYYPQKWAKNIQKESKTSVFDSFLTESVISVNVDGCSCQARTDDTRINRARGTLAKPLYIRDWAIFSFLKTPFLPTPYFFFFSLPGRYRGAFFLPFCSNPDRRARDSYLSAFRAASPWRQLSPPKSYTTEKAARGFPFSFKPYPEARPGFHVLIPAFLPFLRLWRPLSGAAAYSFYNNSFDIYYYI